MRQRTDRNVLFISLSQFGMSFSFNFIMVFIPFFLHRSSPYPSQETLIWIGLIMGAPSFAAALMSSFWGSLTSRFSPKTLFMRGLISHAVLIFVMGYVSHLPFLFVIRVIQGILGGISTVGLIIVSSSSPPERISRNIGFFQNAMTLGQLIGPPAGALAASLLGYRGAFMVASALVFIPLVFCFLFVVEVPRGGGEGKETERHTLNKKTLMGWGLCFTATVQLMFLPSVLPNVFDGFHISHNLALRWAGFVVMFYTASGMVGTYTLCRLSSRVRMKTLIFFVGFLGIAMQVSLAACPGINSFVSIRMLQTAMVAAIPPLVFSIFATRLSGTVMGFMNSGRFAGNALGPMIGTSVLALSGLTWLFLSIGILGLMALICFGLFFDDQEKGPKAPLVKN